MKSIVCIRISSSRELVAAVDFVEQLGSNPDVEIKKQYGETRGIEEIILALISSSSLIVVANALRDFVQKKKIHTHILYQIKFLHV